MRLMERLPILGIEGGFMHFLGNQNLLKEKAIAVVGSRRMSDYGKEVVGMLVPKLVARGLVIVSGMALGIDAEVHRTCLDCGGKTIAVLASGVDVVSPRSNQWIYKRIIEEGSLVVSEFENGTLPKPEQFLQRNQTIAALSMGVIVVEGAKRSGSMVTAKWALEMGKEVYAVPGRITDENSWTPNWLISQGAVIINTLDEINFGEYYTG